MANKVVIFPVVAEAAARAYAAWTDNHSPFPPAPGAWAYVRNDAFGQWVVPYLGAPFQWNGAEFAEPAGGAAMRVAGVLHESVVWPVTDDLI